MLFDAAPIPKPTTAPHKPASAYIPEYQCKIIRAMLAGKRLTVHEMGAYLDGVPCNWRHCQRMINKGLIEPVPAPIANGTSPIFEDRYQVADKVRREFGERVSMKGVDGGKAV